MRLGTHTDSDGDRWYSLPSNSTAQYAGVTSVLATRRKPGIEKGKINGVAAYAAKHRAELAGMTQAASRALLRDEDVVLPDWRVGRDFGTAVHQVVENIINDVPLDYDVQPVAGTDSYPVDNNFTEWVPRHWRDFVKQHSVTVLHVERSCYSHKHGYAGSFDTVLRVDGVVTIVDVKSNKGGPREDVALQNMAYARCDEMIDVATGVAEEMPRIERSAVLWLRPEGWALVPLPFTDREWRVFYGLLLAFQWAKFDSQDTIGEPISGTLALPKRWRR